MMRWGAAQPSPPEAGYQGSLQRTRDELTVVLERVRQLTGDWEPSRRVYPCEENPYPIIRANLRAALAHLYQAEAEEP